MQARIRVIFRRRVGVLIKKVMIVAGAFGVALAGMYWYRERLRHVWNKVAGPAHNSAETRSFKEEQKTRSPVYLNLGEIGHVRHLVGDQHGGTTIRIRRNRILKRDIGVQIGIEKLSATGGKTMTLFLPVITHMLDLDIFRLADSNQ